VFIPTPSGICFVVCAGRGTPPILFDAGGDTASDTWKPIWGALRTVSRLLRYDRPNIGRSAPSAQPCTSQRIVTDLRVILHTVGLPPPYILVGHSFGGLNMQLFARLYPSEIAGLVLIDSVHWEQAERFTAFSAEAGVRFQQQLHASEERIDWVTSAQQLRTAPPLSIPSVHVLSRTRETPTTPIWNQLQRELAAPTVARHHWIADSGHLIHQDQPVSVVRIIRDVVATYRTCQAPYTG
jgi:pimeloyl-ACP methyl ester carboxylesterase